MLLRGDYSQKLALYRNRALRCGRLHLKSILKVEVMLLVRKVLMASVAVSTIASLAFAADIAPREAPPVTGFPTPIFAWAGLYFGVNAGGILIAGSGNNAALFVGGGTGPNGRRGDRDGPSLGDTTKKSNRPGFVGGGQVGYNWQVSRFVLGLETDLQGLTRSNDIFPGAFGDIGGRGGYLGTVRGRLGLAFDRLLIFGTGGLAYCNINTPNTIIGLSERAGPINFTNNLGGNRTHVGYSVGGGVEYAFTDNWSMKVEYLNTDFGQNNVSFAGPSGGALTFSRRERNTIVRAGLNYRFDSVAAPVVARY